MYYSEQKLGWQGPTDLEAFLTQPFDTSFPFFSADGFLWLSYEGHLMLRDAIAMGLTTLPIIVVLVVGAILPAELVLYEVPSSSYQYAVVNGATVLVEPASRKVVYIVR